MDQGQIHIKWTLAKLKYTIKAHESAEKSSVKKKWEGLGALSLQKKFEQDKDKIKS